MRRRPLVFPLFVAVAAVAVGWTSARADLLSKTFVFRPDTTLEIAADIEPGLRLDHVRFLLPSSLGGRVFRVGGLVKAEVAVSNTSAESKKVGIAIALFDDANRLLGVASGGVKLLPIKPNRQVWYTLIFEDVNGEAYKATKFQISAEPKP